MNQSTQRPPHTCDGHIWHATADLKIDRCGRMGCRAMRHFKNGERVVEEYQKVQPIKPAGQPMNLWA